MSVHKPAALPSPSAITGHSPHCTNRRCSRSHGRRTAIASSSGQAWVRARARDPGSLPGRDQGE
eukprot:2401306-Prymnesium_polylepis.1